MHRTRDKETIIDRESGLREQVYRKLSGTQVRFRSKNSEMKWACAGNPRLDIGHRDDVIAQVYGQRCPTRLVVDLLKASVFKDFTSSSDANDLNYAELAPRASRIPPAMKEVKFAASADP
jgi:hypothetical protein